jgi:lipopolysaccharide export system ATP-binding protein
MILRAEHLLKIYKGRSVVNDISVEVSQGEIVGLLGPNGAGKTTSFYMIVGLIQPNSGKIFLEDQDITGLPMYKRAKLGIGYLAQEASVFRKLSVEENILAVLEMTTLTKVQQKEKMESLLEEFSLTHVRKNLGMVLSGGERRRTEIRLKHDQAHESADQSQRYQITTHQFTDTRLIQREVMRKAKYQRELGQF